jgi:SAM-dependent methyltransferase
MCRRWPAGSWAGTTTGSGESVSTYEVNWREHADRLAAVAGDEQDWYVGLAAALVRQGDRVAVDVGCGGGGMAAALAAAVGTGGQVIAADGDGDVLDRARERLAGAAARVAFVVADLADGVEPLRSAGADPADLVWASAAIHHVGDQQAAVTALAGLLRPGGRLALAEGGLGSRRLPWDLGVGEPGLEVRLEAAQDRWFARMRAELPGSVPMPYGWTTALRRAGLVDVTSRTTLLQRPVPLSEADRTRVLDSLGHRVGWLRPAGLVDPADLAAWDRLLDPEDPAYLGRRDDLYSIEARTVHVGSQPA